MGAKVFRISILLRLAVVTILIFVVLDLVAGWIGSELIQWFAGPRAQFGIQDTKFLFGLGAIILGLVSVFVVEHMPTSINRQVSRPDFQPSPRSGLLMVSFVSAGIILMVLAILGY